MIRNLILAPYRLFNIFVLRVQCFFLYRKNMSDLKKLKAMFTAQKRFPELKKIEKVEIEMMESRKEYLEDRKWN